MGFGTRGSAVGISGRRGWMSLSSLGSSGSLVLCSRILRGIVSILHWVQAGNDSRVWEKLTNWEKRDGWLWNVLAALNVPWMIPDGIELGI